MALSLDLVGQLTPQTPAPGEVDLTKEIDLPENQRRRLAWTRYLRSEDFYREYVAPQIPKALRPWHVGVGLIPTLGYPIEAPDYIDFAIRESQYTWGVILCVEAFVDPGAVQTTLDFEHLAFPMIVSPTPIELHDLTQGHAHTTAIGSRTTWAVARKVNRSGVTSAKSAQGLLTARHVPDRASLSSLWSTDAGGYFSVYRRGSPYIDAVYLEGNWGAISPSSRTPKPVAMIASGDNVDIDGAFTNVSCFVTHTPNPHYIGGGSPSHVFLDQYGIPGDSGGLVHENHNLISMYLGKAVSKNGSIEGLSLALEQVVDDLDIELML